MGKEEFVSYEQAVALKEIGFDGDALKVYSTKWTKLMDEEYAVRYDVDYVLAPLKQQVFRWFREKYDAHMHPSRLMRNIYVVRYGDWDSEAFKTYEEAEDACIDKLIELAKQQDNGMEIDN